MARVFRFDNVMDDSQASLNKDDFNTHKWGSLVKVDQVDDGSAS